MSDASDILIDDSDIALEASTGMAIPIAIVVESNELLDTIKLTETSGLQLTSVSHAQIEAEVSTLSTSVMIFECRMLEAFEDLNIVRKIRASRPMLPVIVVCENDDPDFVLEILRSGASVYVKSTSTSETIQIQVHTLARYAQSGQIIETQNREVVERLQAQRQADEKRMKAEAEKAVATAQAEANRLTKEILDNLQQAFFIVESDMKISSTVSRSCMTIFEREIAGQALEAALGLRGETEFYLREGLLQVFEDIMPMEVSLDVLPKRFETLSGKIVDMHYTVITGDNNAPSRIIVGASDVTEVVAAQRKATEENSVNRAIIGILQDKTSFQAFVDDYRALAEAAVEATKIEEAKRALHTMKGNAAAFGLEKIVHSIHEIENELEAVLGRGEDWTEFVIASGYRARSLLEDFLMQFHDVLQLDSDSHDGFSVEVPVSKIQNLQQLLVNSPTGQFRDIANLVRKMAYVPSEKLMTGFENAVCRLADRFKKKIELQLKGTDVLVDSLKMRPLFASLIHSVRNSCDHGIETPEERTANGKPEVGHITVSVKDLGTALKIEVTDDGRGINRDRVINKAKQVGIIKDGDMVKDDSSWLSLVFSKGFSTSSELSEVSGRGMGMDCILAEVKALGGNLKTGSKDKVGTRIVIEVPYNDAQSEMKYEQSA